jgi:hypothetical protein
MHHVLSIFTMFVIWGCTFGTMIGSFIGRNNVDKSDRLSRTALLLSGLLSIAIYLLLTLSLYLVYKHSIAMESSFNGLFTKFVLGLATVGIIVTMLLLTIALVRVPVEIRKTLLFPTVTNSISLLTILTTFSLVMFDSSSVQTLQSYPQSIPVELKPSYQEQDGAFKQLQQLNIGSQVNSNGQVYFNQ